MLFIKQSLNGSSDGETFSSDFCKYFCSSDDYTPPLEFVEMVNFLYQEDVHLESLMGFGRLINDDFS